MDYHTINDAVNDNVINEHIRDSDQWKELKIETTLYRIDLSYHDRYYKVPLPWHFKQDNNMLVLLDEKEHVACQWELQNNYSDS